MAEGATLQCKGCGRQSGVRGLSSEPRILTKEEKLAGLYGWDMLGKIPNGAKSVIQCIHCGNGLLLGMFRSELVSREFCEGIRKAKGIASGIYGDKTSNNAWKAVHHFNLGYSFQEKHQLDSAISEWKEAVKLKPDYAAAYHNLGLAYGEKGLRDMAIKQFEEAIKCGPDLAWADPQSNVYHDLGVTYARKGEYGLAIRYVEQGVKIRPNDVESHKLLNKLYRLRGR